MVKAKDRFTYLPDGCLDTNEWLERVKFAYKLHNVAILSHACAFTHKLVAGMTTFYGRPCLEHGLEIAEIILALKLDQDTAAAGMVCGAVAISHPAEETLHKDLGDSIAKLVSGVRKTDVVTVLQKQKSGNPVQIDKLRKMLLAMATDIRVVIIKLAERLCFMRGIKSIPQDERQRFAQEIQDIYAPLANRLGIGQLKWELEDLAFRYLDPDTYKLIASFIAERRADRETRINNIILRIQEKLQNLHIKADVTGRAKHIYSIFSKMKRKEVDEVEIYDYSAVRILVPTIEDCYTALSTVNSLWPPILAEFDDYIANPKSNGYRSIHTAVVGDDGKHFEIQIRTIDMHEEAERGIAAHWMYKENQPAPQDDKTKIAYLRQLIDWHQEVIPDENAGALTRKAILEEQVYVITPGGDILDLPLGATPIDFAYHIHTEIGHRCRGAKVNGRIVPLNYMLQTGDRVEISTITQGNPSRDWINPELGYVKTTRARSKIVHWFNQQEFTEDIAEGRDLLEKELARSGLAKTTSLQALARLFHFKTEDDFLAAIGRGNIKAGQIVHAIQPHAQDKSVQHSAHFSHMTSANLDTSAGAAIIGATDFLTRIAKCCKPIPGDAIIGYITQGRGISIHKRTCTNTGSLSNPQRFIAIDWDKTKANMFITDLKIIAHDSGRILHELTTLFVNEKTTLLSLNSNANSNHSRLVIMASVKIKNMTQLQQLMHRVEQLPGVLEVVRIRK